MSDSKPTRLHAVQSVHPLTRKKVALGTLANGEQILALKEARGRLYTCTSVGQVHDLITSMIAERETRLEAIANG